MARPEQTRRKFAPVPIETTFESFRKGPSNQQQPRIGPTAELTPEPSPRSPSPPPFERRERRRFAPQLIETSRRARRAGDPGPATKPTDKTDITPYTRHIYNAKTKGRRRADEEERSRPMAPTRRETEDEGVKEYLLELAAKEAERQIQEAALAVFPNSRAREGGVAHFYFRESSESDNSPEASSPVRENAQQSRVRRKSSNLGLSWWHKHMQEHVQYLKQGEDGDEMAVDEPEQPEEGEQQEAKRQKKQSTHEPQTLAKAEPEDTIMDSDNELDQMDLPDTPDPLWITTKTPADRQNDSMPRSRGAIGESLMPLIQPDPYLTGSAKDKHFQTQSVQEAPRPIGETTMPYIPPASTGRPADAPQYASSSQIPPDTGFSNKPSPFGRPFGGLGYKPPVSKSSQQRRQLKSPPMLGKSIVFRKCPSPKQTRLEPDHPFSQHHAEEQHRDTSGGGGLWRGYCFKTESNDEYLVPAELHAPPMLATPLPPGTPGDPYAAAFGAHLSDEPPSVTSSESSDDTHGLLTPEHRVKSGLPKGLHMLHGLDERLKREKANAERNEKIAQEFDDAFVTQVYNYLSLGYPATARAYDGELSKISHMSVDDLEKDDAQQMAQGHLFEADDEDLPEEQRGPRWKALKKYITEWARQHPNLDDLDPLAWGVRERRGSWAI